MDNKNTQMTLYDQVIDKIIDYIDNNNLKADSVIPSERELSIKYNVSRATIRRALSELIQEGILYKIPGKGTFVSQKKFKKDLLKFYSFSEEMKKLNKTPSSKILSYNIIISNKKLAKIMNCKEGEKLYKIERIRYADGEPIMYEINHLLYNRFLDLSEVRIRSYSMYDILIKEYNVEFSSALETLQPVITREAEAKMLNYGAGLPSMLIERITKEKDLIIEYTKSVIAGDKFKYQINLKR
ncbi:hypothetical protein HMPREF9709_01466 [Helcococcus kunzii ATCC 51366]|uniref:HTH gntR-type domain-containing protein n=1 Tax=Helcococcus kunzii ATCC 51366 TaxID=883114 RepID=H3NQ55_9FIRM|nr:GntR family transcriptional regulator [Helcococcus kunzii]EHR32535.1 hypothetical protein HMPREF9709_01466 [Helcococcus kunzii ATCC 51366]MCT1796366.1 GntR family transcriptional regulator [Helcococcus kunzii]MCT1989416.1 GntR family transcriptional regulator [Helcococcus kunzii]